LTARQRELSQLQQGSGGVIDPDGLALGSCLKEKSTHGKTPAKINFVSDGRLRTDAT